MEPRTDAEIAPEIREAIAQFLAPLKTMRSADVRAFERLRVLVAELMRSYKGVDRVSKSLLHELHEVPRRIAAVMEQRPTERQSLEQMAHIMEYWFLMLLQGDTTEERRPDLPRG